MYPHLACSAAKVLLCLQVRVALLKAVSWVSTASSIICRGHHEAKGLVAAGIDPLLAALGLAYVSNLFGSITHYASGQAAAYYGAGYLRILPTFIIGGIFGIGNLVRPILVTPHPASIAHRLL